MHTLASLIQKNCYFIYSLFVTQKQLLTVKRLPIFDKRNIFFQIPYVRPQNCLNIDGYLHTYKSVTYDLLILYAMRKKKLESLVEGTG